jgi:hypothetical protein
MATTATKVPATVPPGRTPAVAASAAAVAAKSEPTGGGSSARGFKLLAWLLIVLNVLGAGAWLYFKYFRTRDAARTLDVNRRQLMRLNNDLTTLHSTVAVISGGKVSEVEDPGKLVGVVAARYSDEFRKKLEISKFTDQPFPKSNYIERSVKVTFLNNAAYSFSELITFLAALEAANPTVQIKDVDFGKRTPPAIGSDSWQPRVATVRVLQLKSSG